MPPKGGNNPSKKSVEAKKAKVVEDRTFGLKNKNKSKKVQAYVENVKNAVAASGKNQKQYKQEQKAKEDIKKAKEAAAMQLNEVGDLFRQVLEVKKTVVPVGVDPKSVVCEFFKAGKCIRGNKCKFSHDLEAGRKVQKMDLYSDPRELQNDTMDNWDQSKLEDVINKKQKGTLPPTDIVCKYFLDAVEQKKYGWFWVCPSGDTCHYRHCLPPGFVLKSDKKAEDVDEDSELTVEEKLEEDRKQLDLSKCTPMTFERFQVWKTERAKKKAEEVEKKRKEAAKKDGTGLGVLSGRDLFTYDPSLFVDDAEADDEQYESTYLEDNKDNDDDEGTAAYDRDNQDNSLENFQELAGAIDENLFLDDDVPDDDEEEEEEDDGGDDDGGEDEEDGDEEEKKS